MTPNIAHAARDLITEYRGGGPGRGPLPPQPFERLPDALHHLVSLTQHLVVPEPQYDIAPPPQPGIPPPVVRRTPVQMLRAVHLHDQTGGRTGEVRDIGPDRVLTPEADPEGAPPQSRP